MSKIADKVFKLLKELFPFNVIIKEHYVNYKGTKLFFDIYVKEFGIFIEIQGVQHGKFVKHFHGDKQGFLESKKRDNLKLEYCQLNNIDIVIINHDEELNDEILLNKLYNVIEV